MTLFYVLNSLDKNLFEIFDKELNEIVLYGLQLKSLIKYIETFKYFLRFLF